VTGSWRCCWLGENRFPDVSLTASDAENRQVRFELCGALCSAAEDGGEVVDHMTLQYCNWSACASSHTTSTVITVKSHAATSWRSPRPSEQGLPNAKPHSTGSRALHSCCRCGEGGLSVEQQRELTAAAAAKADAAAAAASAGAGDVAAAAATAAAVRIRPLGCDRRGAVYYDLGCARLLAGEA
jgi:hypothetical protein